ncbi:MAG: tRNA (adenosine(37)-N6)-dimethylallyltransferase MiaA [Anaerolineales bacterium]|nr:tRNA (adenosine(37)-N6)-dimethylallyltransferase MiaA [Anaerolineales bacterium]
MPSRDLPPLIVILGPTAVGKTEIAIQLAGRLGGEIVSADSRLFYRGMDIGTAKPTQAERERAPHHLVDVADPDQVWSLALFQERARQAIADIHGRGRLPLLVGGAGQYIRAVTQGWQAPQVEPDRRLRAALENWAQEIGEDGLHTRLAVLDPQAAASIDPRNLRRTVRALEVILSSGLRFSEQRRRQPSPYRLLLLGLTRPRPELYARIDARIQDMLAAGFVEEVQNLLEAGYSPELPTLSAIGYREMVAYLSGAISLHEAVQLIQRATRTFVRRQANWFKADDPGIRWFRVEPDTVDVLEVVIRAWLSTAAALVTPQS